MRVNAFVYGILVVALFFGSIGVAKATGNWSVSGKISSTGEEIAPTGTNVDEIKGWMTLGEVSNAYQLPVDEIVAEFGLPEDTDPTTQIKSLESDTFSMVELREWLRVRLEQ